MIFGEDLHRSYRGGGETLHVLQGAALNVAAGESVVLMGPSGSGKTTLLSILGCMLRPDRGQVCIQGAAIDFRSGRKLASARRRSIGFIFQQHRLLPFLTLEKNLHLAGLNAGFSSKEVRERTLKLAETLGIGRQLRSRPATASGGECQRAAIARALITHPPVLLADEPTAALDWENGRVAAELLIQQSKEHGAALIAVTHDPRLLPYFDRALRIEKGRVIEG
jgi:putative ABC transport system ATP-binding protein